MPKFGTKNALFAYFWARILKTYCHIWNQYPRKCQKWVLTHTVNFGKGSAFPKCPGSAFFKGPGPGPGSFYKVCWLNYTKKPSIDTSKLSNEDGISFLI